MMEEDVIPQREAEEHLCPLMSGREGLVNCQGANCMLWDGFRDNQENIVGRCTLSDLKTDTSDLERKLDNISFQIDKLRKK